MEKQRLFKIMSRTDGEILKDMAGPLVDKYGVTVMKEPSKTLAMIKMREPVKSSCFYLGEVIVTEAVIALDGTKGMAVTMGDDYDKVLSMAILDASFNKKIEELERLKEQLYQLEQEQILKINRENALYLKTMVNFQSMDGEARE